MKKVTSITLSLIVSSSLSLYAADACISVVEGWNLKGTTVGFPTQSYFSNQGEVQVVWSFDDATQTWAAYSPKPEIAAALSSADFTLLENIGNDKGYWVNSLVTSCLPLSGTGTNPTENSGPMIYGIEIEQATDTHVIYVAKDVAVNMDLQNYIQDLDGDSVTITTSNVGTLPSGINISTDGKVTGTATTVGQEVTFNAALYDTKTTTYSNLKVVVIETPEESLPTFTYGSAIDLASFNLTTVGTFFEPDVEGMDVEYTKLVFGASDLSITDYILGETGFTQDFSETLSPLNKTATSFSLDVENEQDESLSVLSVKPITQIDGVAAPAGLYEVTVELETTSTLTTYTNITDWWETYYSDYEATPITTISALQTFLVDNEYMNVWINENTQVSLKSGGSVQLMQKDGTFGTCNQCNNGSNYYEKVIPTTTVYSGETGGWGLTTGGYLKVGVADVGATLFKEDNGALYQTELRAVGTTETLKWFYGIDQSTFETLIQGSAQ